MKKALAGTIVLNCILCVLFSVAAAHGQQSVPPNTAAQTLESGRTIERQIEKGETHRYQISLQKGEFFRVRMTQQGINVSLKLLDVNGGELMFRGGLELSGAAVNELSLSFVAAQTGTYFLEVVASKGSLKTTYKLESDPFRLATDDEKKGLAASLTNEANDLSKKAFETQNKVEKDSYLHQAVAKFQNAYLLYEGLGDLASLSGQIICTRSIGINYSQLNENADALSYFHKSLKLLTDLKELVPTVDIKVPKTILLNDLGLTYFITGQEQEALSYLKQVDFENIDYWKSNKEVLKISTDMMLILLVSLGDVEDYEYSIKFINKIIGQASSYGYTDEERMHLDINLSKAYTEAGYYDKSFEALQETLRLNKNYNDSTVEQTARNNIGIIYLRNGNFDEAQKYIQQTLDLATKGNDHVWAVKAKANLAAVYSRKKEYDIALKYFEETLPELKRLRDEFASKFSRTNNSSDRVEEKNLALFVTIGTYYYGMILREMGKPREAINFHKQSAELAITSRVRKFESRALVELGLDYLALNNPELAAEQFEKAFTLSKSAKARDEQMASLDGLMRAWDVREQPRLAIVYGKQSVNLLQQTRAELELLGKSVASEFVKDNENTYRRLANLLISEGRLPEAQTILDLLKEEEYKTVTRSGGTPNTIPYGNAEADVIAKIDALAAMGRRRIELERLQQEKGALPEEEQKALDQINEDIAKANGAFQTALLALKTSEPTASEKIAEIEDQQSLTRTLEALNKDLDAGVVALYTVIGTETIKDEAGKTGTKRLKFGWIVLVTPRESKAYPIDVQDLEETVFGFRAALSSDKYDAQPLAQKLYDKLFRQTSAKQKTTLEADLETLLGSFKNRTIMWSLDGVLRYIPMAALHDGKRYLVENYRNVIFTRQSLAGLNQSDKTWQVLGLGVSDQRENFPALPGVKKELEDIVREANETTGILNGTRRLNNAFKKEDTIRLLNRGMYPVIHIASHFSFNSLDQTASFLLVGDGRLTFADISSRQGLFNAVDLLTLSACDTAMSSNGKESEGFAYLAQQLGANTVIASLWKVSDEGTPELMMRFYKLRAENPRRPKGEAFRQAQLSLLGTQSTEGKNPSPTNRAKMAGDAGRKVQLPLFVKDPNKPFAHPHYWSSFVLIGNWR